MTSVANAEAGPESTTGARGSMWSAMMGTTVSGVGGSVGTLVFRVIVGAVMLIHGVPKMLAPGEFFGQIGKMGVPLPEVAGVLQIGAEVGLPVLIMLGLGTRLAGALMAVSMVLVWLIVHLPMGLFQEGMLNGESAIMMAVAGLLLATIGSGKYAVETFMRR